MSTVAMHTKQVPFFVVSKRRVLLQGSVVLTGGADTVASQSWDDPQCVVAKTGTGTYSVVYPATPTTPSFDFTLFDTGTANIVACRLTAANGPAGTATFVTIASGAAGAAANTSTTLTVQVALVLDTGIN